MSIHELIHSWQ